MTLIVETGAGLSNAESYVAVVDCVAYAANFGFAFSAGSLPAAEAALRRATAYIDNTYRLRFTGYRAQRSAQALEWPRAAAYYCRPQQGPTPFYTYSGGYFPYDQIAVNAIPVEVTRATCECAIRELATPGILLPDLKRGGVIQSLKAGPVDVRYGAGASPNTLFQAIEAALSGLLLQQNQHSGRVSR